MTEPPLITEMITRFAQWGIAVGRDKFKHPKKTLPPFLRVERDLFGSSVWKELSHPATRVYLCFRCAENSFNRRELKVSYNYIRGKGGGSFETIARAIRELKDAGLIDIITTGGLYKQSSVYGISERWKEKQTSTTIGVVGRFACRSNGASVTHPSTTATVAFEPKL